MGGAPWWWLFSSLGKRLSLDTYRSKALSPHFLFNIYSTWCHQMNSFPGMNMWGQPWEIGKRSHLGNDEMGRRSPQLPDRQRKTQKGYFVMFLAVKRQWDICTFRLSQTVNVALQYSRLGPFTPASYLVYLRKLTGGQGSSVISRCYFDPMPIKSLLPGIYQAWMRRNRLGFSLSKSVCGSNLWTSGEEKVGWSWLHKKWIDDRDRL